MDQLYIDALINQALTAYKTGGDEGLKRWLNALPAPHRKEFEAHCAEPLREAIEALSVQQDVRILTDYESSEKALKKLDPRKRHRRDRRRTKPL